MKQIIENSIKSLSGVRELLMEVLGIHQEDSIGAVTTGSTRVELLLEWVDVWKEIVQNISVQTSNPAETIRVIMEGAVSRLNKSKEEIGYTFRFDGKSYRIIARKRPRQLFADIERMNAILKNPQNVL